jgi:ferric-dicitrate binding protein FerR (iron transport regulator)
MNHKLIDKYFNDECSPEELDQVLDWFQTDEGQAYITKDIDREGKQLTAGPESLLYQGVESDKLFIRIQRHKKKGFKHNRWHFARVASILLLAAVLSVGLYLGGIITPQKKAPPPPEYNTYVTTAGQQKIFTLSDGIKIRLDEKSTLIVPTHFRRNRNVTLKGEAYFEVRHNAEHPFVINANGAVIKDLGTKFDVKADSTADDIQVAVMEGKVMLKKEGGGNKTSAVLTGNHFGMLDLSDGQITIEKGNVQNYLSWMTNKLVFHGESLGHISRQLERLYDVKIGFQSNQLKKVKLTANYDKTNLKTVLKLIAHTLDVRFRMSGNRVLWMK